MYVTQKQADAVVVLCCGNYCQEKEGRDAQSLALAQRPQYRRVL